MDRTLSHDQTPFFEELVKYSHHPLTPFHTPGHKGGLILGEDFSKLKSFLNLDLTEIPSLDWSNSLEKAQQLAADLYQADRSFFLVQGASQGIIGGILGAFSPGDTILVGRNCHVSVINAIILADLIPVYLEVEFCPELGIPIGVKPASLETELKNHPHCKGLIITSPTYQGIASNLDYYRALIGDRILLVDEAHGGHLEWSGCGPEFSAYRQADLWVQGTHKILGSLTQTGMLHLRKNRIDETRLQQALNLITTTSPSFILLSSLDLNRSFLASTGRYLFEEKLPALQNIKTELESLKGVTLLTNELLNNSSKTIDPWKICASFNPAGLSGFEAATILRESFQIEPEYADLNQVTFLIAPWQDFEDLKNLSEALTNLGQEARPPLLQSCFFPSSIPPRIKNPREAALAPSTTVVIKQGEGRIAAVDITPYPPGLPLLVPGELIRNEEISLIEEILHHGGIIKGITSQGEIHVIIE